MMSQFTLAASVMTGAPPVAAGLAEAPVAEGTWVAPSGCTAVGEFEPPPPSNAMTAAITSPSTTGRAKKVAKRATRTGDCLPSNPPPRTRLPPTQEARPGLVEDGANRGYHVLISLNLS